MKLANVYVPPKDMETKTQAVGLGAPESDYVPEITIYLDNKHMELLGLDVNDFDLDQQVHIEAVATISSASIDKTERGQRQSMRLCVKRMGIEPHKKGMFESYSDTASEGPEA
ncbi:MAG: capsid staple protein [Dehalococcoidia bacterium]|jgi:hypothetical protein